MISHLGHLVLHVDQPQVLLNMIPSARMRDIGGKKLIVMPHEADEVKLLRNMGLQPPPLDLEKESFRYCGRFKPFDHQKRSVEFLILNKKAFNLSDMGTGKTAAALWAMEYLKQKGKIRRVLIGCPLSVVSVWEEECFNIVPHRSIMRLLGSREKRIENLGKGSEICVINHDGISTILPNIRAAGFDLVILDEASAYRNAQTRRFKLFRDFAKSVQWLWLMTGTPTPKAPTDAYALIKLVNPAIFPAGFGVFKELTMHKLTAFKWIPRRDSKEFVYRHLQPAIRYKKEDCLDLPPVTYVNRICEMTEQQIKGFNLMKQKMIMEQHDGEKITAANAAVKLLKLVQICCGVVRDNQGQHYNLDAGKRLELLKDTVEEAGNKAIVFVPFKGVMEVVMKFLHKEGFTADLVNGDVSERARTKIFDDFQRDSLQVLVAHPRTAAHGLNLTASSNIIWYAPIFSVEQYLQANNRINRPGQKYAMTIAHIMSTSLEAGLYRALWQKISMQTAILQQYEALLK